jgi:homoserine O-succinyltransferase/O-acetyltransferase
MMASTPPRPCGAPALEIALVNNMPDQALEATRRQFTGFLDLGAEGIAYRLRCYALPGVPRSETGRRSLAQSHDDIEALYIRGADAVIVTGAEPRAESLDQEPYWDDFARLVDWARAHTIGALWSCLAAHGAVRALDGIKRQRLSEKLSGVFDCEIASPDWANQGAPRTIIVPHSRYNGVLPQDLESCGYNISSRSEAVGVDSFWRREPSLFLFAQGHPEYDADTLAREFRRDALRFLGGERSDFPAPPKNYFSAQTEARLDELRKGAHLGARSSAAARLNDVLEQETLTQRWQRDSARLYKNWLAVVAGEKARRMRNVS